MQRPAVRAADRPRIAGRLDSAEVTGPPTPIVGVTPRSAFVARARLWQALEKAYEVSFRGCEAGERRGLSGLIALGEQRPEADRSLPCLHAVGEEPASAARGEVRLGGSPRLDRRLRGRVLHEEFCAQPLSSPADGLEVLATVGGSPSWIGHPQRWRQTAASLPRELASDEVLRDRFRGERFLALLPILELLRHLSGPSAWQPPQPRAAFILDDPNLHWPSYGFADFGELADAGERHRFHLAIAAVPLDMWFSHPAAVRQFKRSRGLSLLIHGNDHLRCELGRERPERELLALVAQAQRRVARLERRTGLDVARVMAPPHGECSQQMLRALRRGGLDAACISRPYPWLAQPPATAPLAQWQVSDVPAGCAPVIPRFPLAGLAQDLCLRAYLDQPLVLYGHHWDLRRGLDSMLGLAELVNSFDVAWMGLGEIAAGNYLTREHGEERRLRLFTRRAEFDPPPQVERLLVTSAEDGGGEQDRELVEVRRAGSEPLSVALGQSFPLPPGTGPVELRLRAHDAIDLAGTPAPARSAWARPRRLLVEGRDRLQPLVSRVRPGSR